MPDATKLPPQLRDRVQVLGVLGRGSFGEVLEVRVSGRPEPLALKLLAPEVDMARVTRELEACGRVRHPHLLTVHGYGAEASRGWLLMERADGTLADLLERRDAPGLAAAWEACRQVAAGLAALHAEGIVHRDLKPENVLMVGGVAKVGDLGLAKGGGLETLTATGLVMGTPAFMAPEQVRGEKVTPAVDVFAFGVLLYRVATGRMPYSSVEVRDLLPVLMRGGPVPAGVPLGGCPEVVRACLDPDPARRPSTAELARGLGPPPQLDHLSVDPHGSTRVLTSPGLVRPGDPSVTPVKGVAARNVAMAGGRNLLGVVLVAGLVFGLLRSFRSPTPEPPPSLPIAVESPAPAAWPTPLGEDFEDVVRDDFRRAQVRFVDPKGRILELDEIEGAIPDDLSPFFDADPGTWYRVVKESEGLQRWYRWIAEDGAFWELTAEQRSTLASLDDLYLSEGQTAPFRPWLELAPAGSPPQHFRILGRSGEVLIDGEYQGWTAAALLRMQAALALRKRFEQDFLDYFAGRPSPFPGDELRRLGILELFQVDPTVPGTFLDDLRAHGDHHLSRRAMAPWLRSMGEHLMAIMAAIRQASLHEPEAAAPLPYALNELFKELHGGRLAGYWSLDFEVLVGPGQAGFLVDVLRAVIWDHHGRAHMDLDLGRPEEFKARRAAHWRRPLEALDLERFRAQPWLPWVVRFSIFHGAKSGAPYAELARQRARFEDVVDRMSPAGRADVDGGLAFALLASDARPETEEVRSVLARYRALDPEVMKVFDRSFRDLEPRLEELIREDP